MTCNFDIGNCYNALTLDNSFTKYIALASVEKHWTQPCLTPEFTGKKDDIPPPHLTALSVPINLFV